MGPYFEGRRCWFCGRKTKQQFVDLFHCKCGKSYIKKGPGRWEAFDRTGDMVFCLHRTKQGKKRAMIRYNNRLPAMEGLISEADSIATGKTSGATMKDVFGEGDE